MQELLKIFHFFGLILGIGAGVANMMAGVRLAALPPETGPIVGKFREALGKTSTTGLAILWITGLLLLWLQDSSTIATDPMFRLKIAAVIILTGFSIAANVTVMKAKKAKTPPDAQRMKKISMGAQLFGSIALILAVITFS